MFIKRTAFIALLGLSGLPQAQAITLPSGSCGFAGSCLTYGDFNVYSLAFLNVQAGYGAPVGMIPTMYSHHLDKSAMVWFLAQALVESQKLRIFQE